MVYPSDGLFAPGQEDVPVLVDDYDDVQNDVNKDVLQDALDDQMADQMNQNNPII